MADRDCRRTAFVEGVVRGGLGHERYHLLPAAPVGLSAFRVVALEDACLLAAVAAGAAQGLEVLVKGHGSPVLCETFSCWAMLSTISMVATLTVQTRRSRSMTRSLWSEKR